MLDESNHEPYETHIEFEKDNVIYTFTTFNGASYRLLIFKASSDFFGDLEPNVYSINLSRDGEKEVYPLDYRIQLTIKTIIDEFFQTKRNVIIITADNNDGKAPIRHKLFERWFDHMNDLGLLKFDSEFSYVRSEEGITEINTMYNCLIVRRDHPNAKKIVKLFESINSKFFK